MSRIYFFISSFRFRVIKAVSRSLNIDTSDFVYIISIHESSGNRCFHIFYCFYSAWKVQHDLILEITVTLYYNSFIWLFSLMLVLKLQHTVKIRKFIKHAPTVFALSSSPNTSLAITCYCAVLLFCSWNNLSFMFWFSGSEF